MSEGLNGIGAAIVIGAARAGSAAPATRRIEQARRRRLMSREESTSDIFRQILRDERARSRRRRRKAGRLAAETLDFITPHVQPGVSTVELDRLCHDFILGHKAIPAPLGYRGYPKSICTSINHVVCHGMPGDRALKEGDIVNIDVTFIVDGWYGDSSRMYAIGEISRKAERLIEVRHFCRSKNRMAEMSVPACPIPIQKTKLVMSQAQPTGI